MNPPQTRRPRRGRRPGPALLAILVLTVLAVVFSGCGSSSGGTPAAGATPTSIQVLAKAQRGDLIESAMGRAQVEKVQGKTVVVATIDAQNAASVAAGQSAAVFFFRGGRDGLPQAGGAPFPQGGQSGAPFPQGGQGGFRGGFGPGGERGGAAGTVTAVQMDADGTATATISVAKLPSGATTDSTGFARIETEVLASNVILIPTAAIKGSGSTATVQVVSGGKTETRTITVGQQSGALSEVVSGLNEGENVVYTQSFRGFRGGNGGFPGQSGAPFPQQGGQSGGDQSGGSFQ